MTQSKMRSLFTLFRDNDMVLPPVEAVNERDELYALCDDPMTSPVKLINQQLSFTDAPGVRDCFVENSGFIVVGVVGLQGVGKSSVLNLLANRLGSQKEPFTGPFPVESEDSLTNNHPKTSGVDMYITQDRVILLDTQPLLSWSLTDIYAQTSNENYCGGGSSKLEEVSGGGVGEHRSASSKGTGGPSRWSLDLHAECSSLQIIAFLFSVCHVVVSVTDNLSAPDHLLLRLLDKAASMKPLIHVDDLLLSPLITGSPKTAPQQPTSNIAAHADITRMDTPMAAAAKADEGMDKAVVGVPGSDEVGLEQTPSAIHLQQQPPTQQPTSAQSRQHQSPELQATELAEHAEVRAIVNRLQRLTDYSASLIHVYNAAPPAVFLNPTTRTRLAEYRNLLARSFPLRSRFAALARLGPRILRRHTALRRRRPTVEEQTTSSVPQPPAVLEDQKEEQEEEEGSIVKELEKLELEQAEERASPLVSNSPPSVSESSPKNLLLPDHSPMDALPSKSSSSMFEKEHQPTSIEAVIIPQRESRGSSTVSNSVTSRTSAVLPTATVDDESSMRVTEEEIVADCCQFLSQLAEEEQKGNETTAVNPNIPLFGHPSTIERFFEQELASECGGEGDGEHRAVELGCLTRNVAEQRRNHFDLAKQIQQPRLFLLPATDELGRVAFGCPEYQQKAYQLQEAILSTPRQHMMPNFTELHWFEYAQKTWASVSSSPLLVDYHNLMLTNTT